MSAIAYRWGIAWLLVCASGLSGCHKAPEAPPPAVVAPPPPPPLKPLPPHQPGLWETTLTETGSADPPQKLQICIDVRTDRHLGVLGNDLSGDSCSQKGYRPQGDGSLGFLAECSAAPGVVTEYSGSIDGDYTKDYTMKVRLQTTGPNLNRVANYDIVSRRIGPCAADQKPGDLISDGVKVNLFDIAGMGSGGKASSSAATQASEDGD
ncbi:DUF3617 family protein [Asticcacaulis sp. EMRT-3]|uniref:DUF3617 domain-containing protein n=1 Tax=Asticcacaulis sp. EMRT-3 TaxID=3040349 RepID=UPI0024AFA617|nr:DUF3617 family protein [Asticcacaulis sp. EMRT-3]MDI7776282.1 hypothetical protein [Asticcacaulis sp. EMRT-3]